MFHCVTVVADMIMDKNPVNLTGNVVIIQLLINIVCTNVEITIVNNDIRVVKKHKFLNVEVSFSR